MNCTTTFLSESHFNEQTGEIECEIKIQKACEFVDESLHRYKCTHCDKVFWYSTKGKLAEMRGVDVTQVTNKEVDEFLTYEALIKEYEHD